MMENSTEIGLLPGDQCNRNGCTGIIQDDREGQCSCHINPPCGFCTDDSYSCDMCGASISDENRESEIAEKANKPESKPFDYFAYKKQQEEERQKRYALDDGFLYEVHRYFDDHLEAIIGKDLTLGKAYELRDKMNSKPRYYVYYSIKKQNK